MKIGHRLILLFIIVSLLTGVFSGVLSAIEGSNALEKRMAIQLEGIVVLKENQLHNFNSQIELGSKEIASTPIIKKYISLDYNNPENKEINMVLGKEVLDLLNNKVSYSEFMQFDIVSNDGIVIISTESKNIGKTMGNEQYFIEGKTKTYLQKFYYDISINKLAFTVSTPIMNTDGKNVGVLIGRVKTDLISNVMNERSSLGLTGETYILNKFNYAVSELKYEKSAVLNKQVLSSAAKECVLRKDGFSVYETYNKEIVTGYYKWSSENEVCIIAEINRQETFEPVKNLINKIVIVNIILILIFSILGIFLSRTISKPLLKLTDIAAQIIDGDLTARSNLTRKDEIGDLATKFDSMTEVLQISTNAKNTQIEDLNKELEDLKRKKK